MSYISNTVIDLDEQRLQKSQAINQKFKAKLLVASNLALVVRLMYIREITISLVTRFVSEKKRL